MNLKNMSKYFLMVVMLSGLYLNVIYANEEITANETSVTNVDLDDKLAIEESSLSISPRWFLLQETEPNDTYTTPNRYTHGNDIQGKISSANDADYFNIAFQKTGLTEINLKNIPVGCNYDIELFSSDGTTLLASSKNLGNADEQIIHYVTENTVYYVKIYSISGFDNANFYRLSAVNGDDFLLNNSTSKAYQLYGNPISIEANIISPTDYDYFKIYIPDDSNLKLDLTNIPTDCDYDLYLLNSAGTELYSSKNSNNINESINQNVSVGTYYILIKSSGTSYSSEFYKFNLSYGAVPETPDSIGSATYKYDKIGRLIEVKYETGIIIKYVYDAGGNLLSVQKG